MPPIKIDLLPKSVKYARVNKVLLIAVVAALAVGLLALGSMDAKLRGDIADAEKRLETVTAEAQAVQSLETQVATNRSRLKPIADKVQFIEAADECGYVYWERFYSVIEYIYGGAELHFFAILGQPFQPSNVTDFSPEALFHLAPAGSTDCAFAVTVKNPNEFARFMLNLMRCPEISDIQVTGSVPSGRVIAAQWPVMLQQWNLPQFQMPTFNFPLAGVTGGGAGGGGGMGGAGMDMGGGPGMGGPGMGGGMEMGGGPGMGGGGAGAGAGVAQQPRLDAPIEVLITCRLAKSVGIPMPPQGAAAGGAAPAGGMGGPGMGGPGMGGPGMGGAGMGGPGMGGPGMGGPEMGGGMPGPGGPGGGGGAPPGAPAGGGGGDDSGGGGGGGGGDE